MTSPNKLKDVELETTSHPLPAPHVSTSPSGKRCSEDGEEMGHPSSAHPKPKRPRGRRTTTTPADPVKDLAVRMKRLLKLEVVSSASSRGDPIDPVGESLVVRIRSWKVDNLFLKIDPHRRKPVMGLITKDSKDATFSLQYFSTERYGEICTLFHEASGGYLAVDERTNQPIVHCQPHRPVCSSPDCDQPLRQPLGARPVGGEDDTDSSPPSDPPDPDPCCFFDSLPLGKEACLIPKVCQNRCLTYSQQTLEVRTEPTHRWDFCVLDAHDKNTPLSTP